MLRINIVYWIRAKASIKFSLSHRDVARVLIFLYHNTQNVCENINV